MVQRWRKLSNKQLFLAFSGFSVQRRRDTNLNLGRTEHPILHVTSQLLSEQHDVKTHKSQLKHEIKLIYTINCTPIEKT